MRQKNKEMWIAGINRCIKQRKYGFMQECELCDVTVKLTNIRYCRSCICSKFLKTLRNHHRKADYRPCANIIYTLDPPSKQGKAFAVKRVRKCLRLMREWVEEQ